MTQYPWAQAFQISDSEIERLEKTAATDAGILFHALLQGRIEETTYLKWAANMFQLAFLQNAFFEQPANQVLWNKWQSAQKWRRDFFPLLEWDGVVFIGCVEPPTQFNWSEKHTFILAPPSGLNKIWQQLSHERTAPVVIPTPPAPVAPVQTTVPTPPPAPLVAEDTGSFDFNFSPGTSTETSTPKPAEKNETVAEFTFSSAKFPLRPQENSKAYDHQNIPTALNTKKVIEVPVETPVVAATKTAQTNHIDENTSITTAASLEPLRTPAPESFDRVTSEDEMAAYCFMQMKKHYQTCMLLQIKGGILKPWKWSEGWLANSKRALEPIDVSNPSIFRIVISTKLPYHGYVVENPINRYFFDLWMNKTIPKFVSIFPVVVTNKLEYLVLGVGLADINEKRAQVFMARISEEISEMIYRLSSTKAA